MGFSTGEAGQAANLLWRRLLRGAIGVFGAASPALEQQERERAATRVAAHHMGSPHVDYLVVIDL
jgi:hypothetical protein